jgi:hypothetical protein
MALRAMGRYNLSKSDSSSDCLKKWSIEKAQSDLVTQHFCEKSSSQKRFK